VYRSDRKAHGGQRETGSQDLKPGIELRSSEAELYYMSEIRSNSHI